MPQPGPENVNTSVELVRDMQARANFDPALKIGPWVINKAAEHGLHGLIVRALANDTIDFGPPLIINEGQIDDMSDSVARALDDALVHVSAL